MHSTPQEHNMQNLGPMLWPITLIKKKKKKDSFVPPATQGDKLRIPFHEIPALLGSFGTGMGWRKAVLLILTSAFGTKPPWKQDHAIRANPQETQSRPPRPLVSTPREKPGTGYCQRAGYLFSLGFVQYFPRLQFPWLASYHPPKMLFPTPPDTHFSPLLFLFSWTPLRLLFTPRDWEALFFTAVDHSLFQDVKVSSAAISLCLLVYKDSCQGAGSHTSPRIPVRKQPLCAQVRPSLDVRLGAARTAQPPSDPLHSAPALSCLLHPVNAN